MILILSKSVLAEGEFTSCYNYLILPCCLQHWIFGNIHLSFQCGIHFLSLLSFLCFEERRIETLQNLAYFYSLIVKLVFFLFLHRDGLLFIFYFNFNFQNKIGSTIFQLLILRNTLLVNAIIRTESILVSKAQSLLMNYRCYLSWKTLKIQVWITKSPLYLTAQNIGHAIPFCKFEFLTYISWNGYSCFKCHCDHLAKFLQCCPLLACHFPSFFSFYFIHFDLQIRQNLS